MIIQKLRKPFLNKIKTAHQFLRNLSTDFIKLTLYTKSNCSLCDHAKEMIDELYPNKFLIEEVDITKDRALFRKFKLDIPVFYHNGLFLMQHKVDTNALDSLIQKTDSNK